MTSSPPEPDRRLLYPDGTTRALAWWVPPETQTDALQEDLARAFTKDSPVDRPALLQLGHEVGAALYCGEHPDGIDPMVTSPGGMPWLADRVGALRETVDWKIATVLCRSDSMLASMIVPDVTRALLEPPEEDDAHQPEGDPEEGSEGARPPGGSESGSEGPLIRDGGWSGEGEDENGEDEGTKQAKDTLARAVQQALKVQSALADVCPGLETEASAAGSKRAPDQLKEARKIRETLANRVMQDEKFKHIIEIAGRLSATAWTPKRVPSPFAREDVVGLELGGDLSRASFGYLMRLQHPLLRLVALKDLTERRITQYEVTGTEPLGRGPLAVLLDQSGSMTNFMGGGLNRHDLASALAIGCIRMAIIQKREIVLAGFNRGVVWTSRLAAGSSAADAAPVIQSMMCRTANGGTNFTEPMQWALNQIERGLQADILLLTDGEGDLDALEQQRTQLLRARLGLRVFLLQIGHSIIDASWVDEIVPVSGEGDVIEFGREYGST